MSIFTMIIKSLKQHVSSTLLSIFSIAVGCSLLLSVVSLREQSHLHFFANGSGVDAVLAPKGSPLQVVLNSIFHMEEMPGTISWEYFEKVLKNNIVDKGIPFCTGHSYGGYRVNAIDRKFFTDFEYQKGKKFSFDPSYRGMGRCFSANDEAVIGWTVANKLNMRIGDIFNPVCGVDENSPAHKNDNIRIVGIIAPTGTPHDNALYIPLESFYSLEGHSDDVSRMGVDKKYREISGAYLKIKKIRNDALHPGIQELRYNINQSSKAQFVIPSEVIPKLMSIIGWVDQVLLAISIAVIAMSLLFLFSSLLSAMKERRRDIALLRSLGATKKKIFLLSISEAVFIAIIGGLFSLVISRIILTATIDIINLETGMHFSAFYISLMDKLILPMLFVSGLLAGFIPSVQVYKTDLLSSLRQIS